jgi:hypothetical protein
MYEITATRLGASRNECESFFISAKAASARQRQRRPRRSAAPILATARWSSAPTSRTAWPTAWMCPARQPMEIAPNLFAQEINVLEEVREHWGEMQGYLGNILRKQGMNKAVSRRWRSSPAWRKWSACCTSTSRRRKAHFDCVIVDAAPTGETIRLLTMPESFQWYVGRLRGWGDATLRIASGLHQPLRARQRRLRRAQSSGGAASRSCRRC